MALPLLSKLLSSAWRATRSAALDPTNSEPVSESTKDIPQLPYMIDDAPIQPTPHRTETILRNPDLVLPDRQCPLCLSPRGVAPESGGTCVTECGHVFCWSCIQEWGHEKVRRVSLGLARSSGEADVMCVDRKNARCVDRR